MTNVSNGTLQELVLHAMLDMSFQEEFVLKVTLFVRHQMLQELVLLVILDIFWMLETVWLFQNWLTWLCSTLSAVPRSWQLLLTRSTVRLDSVHDVFAEFISNLYTYLTIICQCYSGHK